MKHIFSKGPIVLNLEMMKASLSERGKNTDLKLTIQEFNLLKYLMMNDRIISREELQDRLFCRKHPRLADKHICNLRKKLGLYGQDIRTISKFGYRYWRE